MKQQIKDFLFIEGKFISKRSRLEYFKKHDKLGLYYDIKKSYDDSYSLRECVMMILSDIKPQKCKMCQSFSLVNILNGITSLSNYCSNSCKNKDMAFIMKDIIPMRDEVSAQAKREATLLKKTGFKYNSQRPDLKHFWNKSKLAEIPLSFLSNKDWLIDQYKTQNKPSQQIAKEIGVFYGSVLAFIDNHGIKRNLDYQRSFQETLLQNEINLVYSGKIIFNDRNILKPKHLDFYFPDRKLAIEIDGLYWHSAATKEISKELKHYHKDKTDNCNITGVNLIHFTDIDIKNKLPLVMSMIESRLGITKNKIHARKCSIKEITAKESKIFFENNHISGYAIAKINIALIYEDKIVTVASFKKPRFTEEADWELIRLATAIDHNVVGGFQKILKYFKNNNSGSILSYCDKRYGTGNVYKLAGFEHIRTTEPGYFWTGGNDIFTRYQTQKSKLPLLLGKKYIIGTEDESMFFAKYRKFWDCGHKVFLLK